MLRAQRLGAAMSGNNERARREWTDAEIDELALRSPEFPEITDADLAAAVAVGRTGRRKVPISIRVDEEALEQMRAMGGRYQTRINELITAHAAGELMHLPPEWSEFFEGRSVADEVRRIVSEHIARERGGREPRPGLLPSASVRTRLARRRNGVRWQAEN